MHRHLARVRWERGAAAFADGRYSRVHRWEFDGGARVEASASPAVVPEPWSSPAAVDPEEALLAAVASCHMLWFLSLAARRGFVVDSYADEATAALEPNAEGRMAFGPITLRPAIAFDGRAPSAPELESLHAEAHERCFVANSLRSPVVIEATDRAASPHGS